MWIVIVGNTDKKLIVRNTNRSSHLQMLLKIGVLKNIPKFIGKHLCWRLYLVNLQASFYLIEPIWMTDSAMQTIVIT